MRPMLVLVLSAILGCSSTAGTDVSETARAGLESSSEYDAALAAPDAIVHTREPASPAWPVGFRTIGFYPNAAPDAVRDRITAFAEWTGVLANDQPVFDSATVTADTTTDGLREVMLSLVVRATGRPRLDLVVTVSSNEAGDKVIHAENHAAVFLSPSGGPIVVQPGDFRIDAVIGHYRTGTIVDATMKVKTTGAVLNSLAGPALAPILPALIQWSRAPR